MANKINIAELLKNCPKGMELDCTMFDNVTLFGVNNRENTIFPIRVLRKDGSSLELTKYGQYADADFAKCIIFPKGKTTWEGFHRPFKDGDVVAGKNYACSYITIFRKFINNDSFSHHVCLTSFGKFNVDDISDNANLRFATKEEKQKLFDAIKDKGYKWNEETKILEKLKQPWTIQYAKDGDVLAFDDETIVIFKGLYNNTSFHSYCRIEEGIFTTSKEDMPDWWRAEGFYPATEAQCTLLFRKIKEAGYKWNPETKTLEKLVQPKFDITTLKPFDRVLVRDDDSEEWTPNFYGYKRREFQCVLNYWSQCIPYEGNEHLLGTTEDCAEFYKNWE